ncbi:uncharacterized protein [Euphorbia lathyris]|uniref:uncharacterized protein n=1 Tax=Euphorbia lathyris TaxID=212925 RepID=UPI003313C32E
MGCFLACFGSSNNRKRNKQRYKVQVQPRDNRNAGFKQAQPNVSVAQSKPVSPQPNVSVVQSKPVSPLPNVSVVQSKPVSTQPIIDPVSEIRVKPEKQLSLSPHKKVTFDSNVTTYEHIKVEESTDLSVEKEDGSKRKEKEENLAKQSQSQSCSEDSSITSSSGSYPSNHRYQNCRDSDDELDCGESDVHDDEEDEEDEDGVLYYDDVHEIDEILGPCCPIPVPASSFPEREVKANPNARDRSTYVHSVLNPVENLTQWKAVKAKGTPPLKQQKENLTMKQEPEISLSSEPSFRFNFKEQSDQQSKKSDQEIAVDASLSNWLGSSESTPVKRPGSTGLSTTTPEKSRISIGSNSPKIFEDRPILGALTVEEIKQFSATSSPKRSPSRSLDDMPIIGTVGTYWNHNVSSKDSGSASPLKGRASTTSKDSGSASSFKGIPNTTSKYREDKIVNWHSTPFETRLERALKEPGAC